MVPEIRMVPATFLCVKWMASTETSRKEPHESETDFGIDERASSRARRLTASRDEPAGFVTTRVGAVSITAVGFVDNRGDRTAGLGY